MLTKDLDLFTLRVARTAVAAEAGGLIEWGYARYKAGPFNLQRIFPGIYGVERDAVGAMLRCTPTTNAVERSARMRERGLDRDTCFEISEVNDCGSRDETMQSRRIRVLAWLDSRIRSHPENVEWERFKAEVKKQMGQACFT
ncbi:MAG: hypothetical protein KGL39_12855 [Patescibacteria group bacterium]|nr:hypothetical protein [Patescibacteria group bacterium]